MKYTDTEQDVLDYIKAIEYQMENVRNQIGELENEDARLQEKWKSAQFKLDGIRRNK